MRDNATLFTQREQMMRAKTLNGGNSGIQGPRSNSRRKKDRLTSPRRRTETWRLATRVLLLLFAFHCGALNIAEHAIATGEGAQPSQTLWESSGVTSGTSAGQQAPPLPVSTEGGSVAATDNPLLLQSADLTADDLPLDADGRSALDGRIIPGIRPRRVLPEALKIKLDDLKAQRAEIAAGVPETMGLVVPPDPPDGTQYAPARLDTGAADPEHQTTALSLPAVP